MPNRHKWFTFYWLACKKFGAECYHTWRTELLASAVVAAFIYFLTVRENRYAWKDFRTALLATGLTLGAFALWHLVRIPWLTHKQVTDRKEEEHWKFGVLGIVVMAALLFGSYSLSMYLIEISRVSVTLKIPAPPAPQISVKESKEVTLKENTLLLANSLEAFDTAKRMDYSKQGISGHEQEPNVQEKAAAFDRQTEKEFRRKFAKRITSDVNEFRTKGVNVSDIPSVEDRLKNWNWNGQNRGGSPQLAKEFAGYLRKLADQIDTQGNLIH